MNVRRRSIAAPTSAPWTMSPARSECSTRSCTSRSIRAEPVSPSTAISSPRQLAEREHARAQRVVDVVVDVGDAVDEPHDLALERGRLARAARVAQDAVAHRRPGEASSGSTTRSECSLCRKPRPKRSRPHASSTPSPMCPNGGWPRSCPSPIASVRSSLRPQRTGDRAGDLRRLERVGEPRAVVVALGRHEDLGLVLEPPERLRVHDPVAVALERRPQPAVGLLAARARPGRSGRPAGRAAPPPRPGCERHSRRRRALESIVTGDSARAARCYEECAICACAAATRATGTRYGEHDT